MLIDVIEGKYPFGEEKLGLEVPRGLWLQLDSYLTIEELIVGLSPPRCRHLDNLCKQFSVEEEGFWQRRLQFFWTHCLMMSRGVVFWDTVSNIISNWSPVYQKLVLIHPVSDPVESHINCFAPLLLHCAFEEANRCFIVHLHRSMFLGVAHLC